MTKSTKNTNADVTTEISETSTPKRDIQTKFRAAILSRSGNVGKTTLANHLLAPRMEGVDEIIYIESINAGDETQKGKMVRAAQFEKVARKIMESMSVIVDIGASNIEETLELMRQIEGSHEDLDYIIVPIIKSPKQRQDSINTVYELVAMGIDPAKIKAVYNRVGVVESVEEEFADVIFALNKMGVVHNPDAVVYESNFFPKFHEMKTTLEDLFSTSIEDNKLRQNDLRRMEHRTEEETAELQELSGRITLQRNAMSAITNLDNVYESLFSA